MKNASPLTYLGLSIVVIATIALLSFALVDNTPDQRDAVGENDFGVVHSPPAGVDDDVAK